MRLSIWILIEEKVLIKAVIFDLDGTLLFTKKANYFSYKQAFKLFDVDLTENQYNKHFGLRFDGLAENVAPHLNATELDKIRTAKAEFYKDNYHLIKPNNNLISFLRFCSSNMISCLCTTASRRNVEPLIKYFELHNCFDMVVCGEDVENAKPHPDCFKKVMLDLDLKKHECLIFEDSSKGIAAATKAGVSYIKVEGEDND